MIKICLLNSLMKRYLPQTGSSMISLMTAILLMAILLGLATPSFYKLYRTKQLQQAGEELYHNLLTARSLALTQEKPVYFNVATQGTWCYGANVGADCACNQQSCPWGGNRATTYPGINLTSTQPLTNSIIIDAVRGTVSKNLDLSLQSDDVSLHIMMNTLGRVTICSSQLPDYKPC